MLSRRPHTGFSLIEMMIVVAIVAIVSAIAFPSYRVWIQNTKIRSTAESIQNGLQIARAEAVKRNASVQFVLGLKPDLTVGTDSEWVVGCAAVVPAPVAPAVTPLECPAVIQSRSAGEGSSGTVTVATTPAANKTVVFTNLGTVAPAPVPFSLVEVDISTAVLAAGEGRKLNVALGVGGNVRMCDPNSSQPSTMCP